MATKMSTLCYIRKDGKYLMLHRTVKKNDVNRDKWIGVGGHFEADESPEECVLREVKEETGYTLTSWQFRGIVTFISGNGVTEYMHLFTADGFTGTPIACDEGELAWVDIEQVWKLNIWAGDKIFFRLIDDGEPFFSLKLVYDGSDVLKKAVLNGKEMELFDLIDEDDRKTGVVQERGVVHREGDLHGTAHMWVIRPGRCGKSGWDVLLQKRSSCKDSFPGCYDTSSAGHMSAGDTVKEAALREIHEELGLSLVEKDLHYIGNHRAHVRGTFYGHPFLDNELAHVFAVQLPAGFSDEGFHLQAEEISGILWLDAEECFRTLHEHRIRHCVSLSEFDMVLRYIRSLGPAA